MSGFITSRAEALEFLLSRIDYERIPVGQYGSSTFKLQRMRNLMAALGDPQDALAIVHVAGTKGKGSTATMVAAMLTAAGHRTGLFTSPHLHAIEERMVIDGHRCSEQDFVRLLDEIRPHVERLDREVSPFGETDGPTYFEITTAMAFLYFARQGATAAAIEVGMGGRLDSTNICRPRVSVITSISFDHMKQLGNTLAAIAREKAGIIKPGIPVVSGETEPETLEVIAQVAHEQGCKMVQRDVDFGYSYLGTDWDDQAPHTTAIDYWERQETSRSNWKNVALAMAGRHQAANAAVALAAVSQLRDQGWSIPESACREGLASAACPARVEVVSRQPLIVLDAAHNVASVEALLETLSASRFARRRWLVFGTTLDKQLPEMLQLLLPQFDRVVATKYLNNPRAVPVEDLMAQIAAQSATACVGCESPADAWRYLQGEVEPDDLVCITGSFFMAAEMGTEIAQHPLRWSPQSPHSTELA
jgi:dihydrofolate synthase/folylpolyglutamate synthase